MERDRLKTLFLPFKDNGFKGYYQRFEQRAQNLDRSDLEAKLQSPTYKHQLREMFIRLGVGVAVFYGIKTFIQPLPELTPLHWAYLFSLGPQYIAIILPSVTRNIMIETEQKILQKELAKRQF